MAVLYNEMYSDLKIAGFVLCSKYLGRKREQEWLIPDF